MTTKKKVSKSEDRRIAALKKIGSKGGKAMAAKKSPRARSIAARHAANVRWGNKK